MIYAWLILSLMIASAASAEAQTASSTFESLQKCVDEKIKNYSQRRAFEQSGNVTCRPTDIVGFPPKERRHRERSEIFYTAPDGFIIENLGVGSIKVLDWSAVNGSIGVPRISSDNRTVSVEISCTSPALFGGRGWQEIRIVGNIVRFISTQTENDFLLQCGEQLIEAPGQ